MWLLANVGSHPRGFRTGLLYWDAAVLVLTYGLVVQLLFALQRVQRNLQARLEQRTISLAEVHHRVKNNLQIISSLLMLRSEKLADPADRAIFGECRDRIHSMARLHEQLYSGRELTGLDFATHLRELATTLVRSHTPPDCALSLQIRADPLPLDLDRAVTLSLVANELILNALKHAFVGRGSGKINVGLRSGTRIEMSVEDDGRGLPPRFDANGDGNLGFELVRAMVHQIAGESAIQNIPSGGTSATIVFPSLPQPGKSDVYRTLNHDRICQNLVS
jgi:two-component sensor histidine kinase